MRRKTERGATLVESAILIPLVVLLTCIAIDGSMYFESYLSIGYASKTAVRVGTARANLGTADYEVLQSIKKSKFGLGPSDVERIIVYKAASFDSPVPQECTTAVTDTGLPDGVDGVCNVYVLSDLNRPASDFGDGTGFVGDQHWPAWLREASRAAVPDLVGVAIQARASTPTGILGHSSMDVTRVSVMQIEARTR